MNGATPTTQDTPDKGRLQINLVSDISAYPIQGAQISIFYTGIPEAQLEQLTTDSSGQTDTIDLAAPPLESRKRSPAIFRIYHADHRRRLRVGQYCRC